MENNKKPGNQGAYEKVRLLGVSERAKTSLVQSKEDKKFYALKKLKVDDFSPEQKEDAMQNLQLHSLVDHKNVIRLKDIFYSKKKQLCIVSEYVQGNNLESYIKERAGIFIPEDQVLHIFWQICLGLSTLHQKKIIHRDLKCSNIFLSKDGNIKIGHFAISQSIDMSLQAEKLTFGQPCYLAPQLIEGKKSTKKTDVWALGIILYQLCALKIPFQANSFPILTVKIIQGAFSPLTDNYSADLRKLITTMLQPSSNNRPHVNEILTRPILLKHLPKEQLTQVCSSLPNFRSKTTISSKTLLTKSRKKTTHEKSSPENKNILYSKKDKIQQQNIYSSLKTPRSTNREITSLCYTNQEKKKREPIIKIEKEETNKKKQRKIQFLESEEKENSNEGISKLKSNVSLGQSKISLAESEQCEFSELESPPNYYRAMKLNELHEMVDHVKDAEQELKAITKQSKKNLEYYANKNFVKKKRFKSSEVKAQQNHSSALQQCREILEQGLGEPSFKKAYEILQQYINEQKKKTGQKIELSIFNKKLVQQKLHFLAEEKFQKYIALLLTLLILEDEQTQKNVRAA